MAQMVTVACVLRSGGDFTTEYVTRLRDAVARHTPQARFVCLSDVPEVATHPLQHDWPGWWAKICLFTPGLLTGPTLYLDLDTVITGDLTALLQCTQQDRFMMLRDFYNRNGSGSGVMGWQGDWSAIYYAFRADPQKVMANHRTARAWGDQAFIAKQVGSRVQHWQDVAPGMIASYKAGGRTQDTRVVCFHGKPRPHEVGWRV